MTLAAVALAFLAFSVLLAGVDDPGALAVRFDTAYEANVPTWFSTVLWIAAGALAIAIGAAARRGHDPGARGWTLVGSVFLLASLDEAGQLHEQAVGPLMDAVEQATGLEETTARVVAVACVGAVLTAMAVSLWPWLRGLSGWLRLRLLASGALVVGGALALEVISRASSGDGAARYLSPLEEFFEMLGVSLLVATLLPALRAVLVAPQPGPAGFARAGRGVAADARTDGRRRRSRAGS